MANIVPSQNTGHMEIETCINAWLAEKVRLSNSPKTEKAYRDTLTDFRATLHIAGIDLDAPAGLVAPLAQGWANKSKTPGKEIAWTTFNQRLAILSSFYEYAIRHEVLTSNPIERVKRAKPGKKEHRAFKLSEQEVSTGLTRIDRNTLEGKRDYALLTLALNTGRRASELAGLRSGHLQMQGDSALVQWVHTKGGEGATNTLGKKVTAAIALYLTAEYGNVTREADAPVFVSYSDRNKGQAISARTIERICGRYLGTSKVHATRHTFAVTMHHQDATLSQIGAALGHKNLKTTSDYMEEQLGYENPFASALEDAYGM
jgi:site-specific recombinase XerD